MSFLEFVILILLYFLSFIYVEADAPGALGVGCLLRLVAEISITRSAELLITLVMRGGSLKTRETVACG